MKIKLLSLIICSITLISVGFSAENVDRTVVNTLPHEPLDKMEKETFQYAGSGRGYGVRPEAHTYYARNQIISVLQENIILLDEKLNKIVDSIIAMKAKMDENKKITPIQTISFAELKQIFNEAKAAR